MNHEEIGNRQTLDLYLMGRLGAAEEETLEEHLLDCLQCNEELELRRAFIGGIRDVAREAPGLTQDTRNWRPLALAASVLLAITTPLSLWSLHELGEVRSEYAALPTSNTSFMVMPLVSTRGIGAEAANVVELSGKPQWLVFELEGDYLQGTDYAVRVMSGSAQSVQRSNIVPDGRGVLVVGIPSTALAPGNYTLEVSGGQTDVATRRFALQVVRAEG